MSVVPPLSPLPTVDDFSTTLQKDATNINNAETNKSSVEKYENLIANGLKIARSALENKKEEQKALRMCQDPLHALLERYQTWKAERRIFEYNQLSKWEKMTKFFWEFLPRFLGGGYTYIQMANPLNFERTRTDLDEVIRTIYLDMAPKGNRPAEPLSKNIWGVEEVGDRVTVWVRGQGELEVNDVKVVNSGIEMGGKVFKSWEKVAEKIRSQHPGTDDLETVKKATHNTLAQYFVEKEKPLTGKEWYVKQDGSNYLLCQPDKQTPFSIRADGCLKTGDLVALTLPLLFPALADEDCLAKKNRIPILRQILAKGVSGIYTEGQLKIGKQTIPISKELPEMESGSFFVAESEKEGYFITFANKKIGAQKYQVSEDGKIDPPILQDKLSDQTVGPPDTLWQKVEKTKLKELVGTKVGGFFLTVPKPATGVEKLIGALGAQQPEQQYFLEGFNYRFPIEFVNGHILVQLKFGNDKIPIRARTVEELKRNIPLGLQYVGMADFLEQTSAFIQKQKYDTPIEPANLAACCTALKWENPSPWRIELPIEKNRKFVIQYGPRLDQRLEVEPVKRGDKWCLKTVDGEFDAIQKVVEGHHLRLEDCVSSLLVRKQQYDISLEQFLNQTLNYLDANKYDHRMNVPDLAAVCATLKWENPHPWRIEPATLKNPTIVIQHGPDLGQRLEVEPVKRGEKWRFRAGEGEFDTIEQVLQTANLDPNDCVSNLYVRKVLHDGFRTEVSREIARKNYAAKIGLPDLQVICTTFKEENPHPWRIELPTQQNPKIVIQHGPQLQQTLEVEPVKRADKWRFKAGEGEFDSIENAVVQGAGLRLEDSVSNLVARKKQYDTSITGSLAASSAEFKKKNYDAKINPPDLQVICTAFKEENPHPWRIELSTQQNPKIVIQHGPNLGQKLEVEPVKRADKWRFKAGDREFDTIEDVLVQGAGLRLEDSVSNLVARKQYHDHVIQLQQSQESEYREWVLKECKAKKYDAKVNLPQLTVIGTALKGENPLPWRIEIPAQQNQKIVIQHGPQLQQTLEVEPVKRAEKWRFKAGDREFDAIEDVVVQGAGLRLEDSVSNLDERKRQYDNLVLELTGQRKGWLQLRKEHYFYEGAIHSPEEEEAQRTRLKEKAKNARNPIAGVYEDTQNGQYFMLVCSPKGDVQRLPITIETTPVPRLVCQDRRGATLGSILPEGVTSFSGAQPLEKRAKADDEFFSVAGQTFFTEFSSFEEVEHAVGDLRDHIPENKRVVVVFRDADKRLCLYALTKAGAAGKYFIDQDGANIDLYTDERLWDWVSTYESFDDFGYQSISFDQLRAQPAVPAGAQFSQADFDVKGKHFFTESSHEEIKNRLLAIRAKIPEGHRVVSVIKEGDAYFLYTLRGGEGSEVRVRMLAKKPDGISLMLRGGMEKEKFASFEVLCTRLNALTLLDVEAAPAPEAPAQAAPAEAPEASVEISASGEWLEDTSDPITDAEAKDAFPALVASHEPLTRAHQFRVWVKGLAIARTEAEKARVEAAKERMKHFSIVDQFWLYELAKGSTVVAEGTRRQQQAQEITSEVFEESVKDERNKEALRQYFGHDVQE